MEYTKQSETEIKIVDNTPRVEVTSLIDLKAQEKIYIEGIADCEAKLVPIREKIAQAELLGVVEKVEPLVEPIEELPVEIIK
jgi:hypothetical protein